MEDALKLFIFIFYITAIFALIFGFASKIDERNSKIKNRQSHITKELLF